MSGMLLKNTGNYDVRNLYMMEELLAVMTAVGVVITAQEVNLDNLMLAWCLAGSVGAALASIALWLPDTLRGRICMFIANCLIGLIFGPFTVNYLHDTRNFSINMANCLAVSATLSILATGVLRPLVPKVTEMLETILSSYAKKKIENTFKKEE